MCLEDGITSSQGDESQMYASILNNIRGVEPQNRFHNSLEKHRKGFSKRETVNICSNGPVTTCIEEHLEENIVKLWKYQD